MANQQLYVLNDAMAPCPDWVPGSLYIGGIGLAQGYWRDEKKTRAVFVTHPVTGERLYHTGDMGRYLPDGTIEFLGRKDSQVKIRGYRIELGEIEAAMKQHPSIKEAVVLAVGNHSGDRRLNAYVVFSDGVQEGAAEINRFLEPMLPDYMLPAAYTRLDTMPLTPNGKIDRKVLSAMTGDMPHAARDVIVAPVGAFEKKIAGIWKALLGREDIGVNGSFFELGGNSMMATQLYARLREEFEKEIDITTVFEYPTIREMARHLETSENHTMTMTPTGEARGSKRRQAALRKRRTHTP
jgi:acyl carrier protein